MLTRPIPARQMCTVTHANKSLPAPPPPLSARNPRPAALPSRPALACRWLSQKPVFQKRKPSMSALPSQSGAYP